MASRIARCDERPHRLELPRQPAVSACTSLASSHYHRRGWETINPESERVHRSPCCRVLFDPDRAWFRPSPTPGANLARHAGRTCVSGTGGLTVSEHAEHTSWLLDIRSTGDLCRPSPAINFRLRNKRTKRNKPDDALAIALAGTQRATKPRCSDVTGLRKKREKRNKVRKSSDQPERRIARPVRWRLPNSERPTSVTTLVTAKEANNAKKGSGHRDAVSVA
jgi:hypothetical protein